MLRLNTFVISHFSEKVRWALDFEAIPYEERRLLPGPHLLVTKRLARASTVRILEHDGRAIQGSSAILDYLGSELGQARLKVPEPAAARCAELEALADHAFGAGVQRIAYAALLKDRRAMIDLWTQGGPAWGRAFYALAFSGVASAVKRMYDLTPQAVSRAKDDFRQAMREFDRALGGQSYFAGEQPKRIDIAVAALLAPLCCPPEHLVKWPALPEGLSEFTREFADSPTWLHALKMYRVHRGQTSARLP
jgi:glutathione S-transferase